MAALERELEITALELDNMVGQQEGVVRQKKERDAYRNFNEEITNISAKQDELESLRQLTKKRKSVELRIGDLESAFSKLRIYSMPQGHSLKDEIEAIDRDIQSIHMQKGELVRAENNLKEIERKQENLPPLEELVNSRNAIINSLEKFQELIDISEIYTSDKSVIETRYNDTKSLLSIRRKDLVARKFQINKLTFEKSAHESMFERITEKIQNETQFSFLSNWLQESKQQPAPVILRTLDGRLNDFLNLAGELRIRVKGVGDYHRILLRAQASRSFSSLSGSEEMRMLESIYNEHLKQFYDNQIFFRYVFEGFVNIQSFNLRTSEILLVDTKGETQIKPISTFSTGQKAFAFSIAMMSIVFARHSKNKVLILDEFGALLDFMREDVLIKQIS